MSLDFRLTAGQSKSHQDRAQAGPRSPHMVGKLTPEVKSSTHSRPVPKRSQLPRSQAAQPLPAANVDHKPNHRGPPGSIRAQRALPSKTGTQSVKVLWLISVRLGSARSFPALADRTFRLHGSSIHDRDSMDGAQAEFTCAERPLANVLRHWSRPQKSRASRANRYKVASRRSAALGFHPNQTSLGSRPASASPFEFASFSLFPMSLKLIETYRPVIARASGT